MNKGTQKYFLAALSAIVILAGITLFSGRALATSCTHDGSQYCTGNTCTCIAGCSGNYCDGPYNIHQGGSADGYSGVDAGESCPSGWMNCDNSGPCDSPAGTVCKTCSCNGYDNYYRCHYLEPKTAWSVCSSHGQSRELQATVTGNQASCSCSDAAGAQNCNLPPTVPSVEGPENCDKGKACGGFKIKTVAHDTDLPNPDMIKYQIKWNAGDPDTAAEDFPGGFVPSYKFPADNNMSHTWNTAGLPNPKTVQVRACDNPTGLFPSLPVAGQICSDWSAGISVNVLQCGNNFNSSVNPQNTNWYRDCYSDGNGDRTDLVSFDHSINNQAGSVINEILRSNCTETDKNYKCRVKCNDIEGGECGDVVYAYKAGNCVKCTPNCCEQTTCAGQTCANSCGQDVPGEKDCRQENWVEQSPE